VALSEQERAMLKRLQDKEKEPAAPPVGRVINVTVDLGSQEQIDRAIEHGFLTRAEATEDQQDSDGSEEGDEAPRRKGYFGA
jgi:hypothetical protein